MKHPRAPEAGGVEERYWGMDTDFPITVFFCSSWGPMSLPTLDGRRTTGCIPALFTVLAFGDKGSPSGPAGLELLLPCLSRGRQATLNFHS